MSSVLFPRVFLLVLLAATCWTSSVAHGQFVNSFFTLDEGSWNDGDGIDFIGTHIPADGNNSWGQEDGFDTYAQLPSGTAFTDIFLPPEQNSTPNEGGIIMSFDTEYLTTSSGQSYLSYGSFDDLDRALWFGFGTGNTFLAGIGSDLDISGNVPTGVEIAFETEATYESNSRIGLRLGFDIEAQTIRNFQVDSDNDGNFDDELIPEPIDISAAGLIAQDWINVAYFGEGGTRFDDVSIQQLPNFRADYSNDLEFNGDDLDLICSGIATGDITFDLNEDGLIDIADRDFFVNNFNTIVGDFDFNRNVSFADFLILSGNFGLAGTNSDGDADCNGTIGFADFLIMSSFFGNGVAQPVPEPSGFFTVAVGLLFLASLRKKR